jgi:hypothetical protein
MFLCQVLPGYGHRTSNGKVKDSNIATTNLMSFTPEASSIQGMCDKGGEGVGRDPASG